MASNAENLKKAFRLVEFLVKETWEQNAPKIASRLVEESVRIETSEPHRNITGNMITSAVAGDFSGGQLRGLTDYSGKKAVRGMLTKGELFEGITWDNSLAIFRGSVDTSGATASDENEEKVRSMRPRLPHSVLFFRGTPYANQLDFLADQQIDVMTNLLMYAKGIKIEPAR